MENLNRKFINNDDRIGMNVEITLGGLVDLFRNTFAPAERHDANHEGVKIDDMSDRELIDHILSYDLYEIPSEIDVNRYGGGSRITHYDTTASAIAAAKSGISESDLAELNSVGISVVKLENTDELYYAVHFGIGGNDQDNFTIVVWSDDENSHDEAIRLFNDESALASIMLDLEFCNDVDQDGDIIH